ncbi:MAG: hypothetical protein IJK26_09310 [Clostridia bacterium]|nr:hypothetical protein [Clostridia bacterium]
MLASGIIVGLAIMLIVCVIAFLAIKEEIEYRRTLKNVNASERERKRQNKTIDEWYGKE